MTQGFNLDPWSKKQAQAEGHPDPHAIDPHQFSYGVGTSQGRNMMAGKPTIVKTRQARTGTGSDGEMSWYRSGGDLILQIYSAEDAAWFSVTLT